MLDVEPVSQCLQFGFFAKFFGTQPEYPANTVIMRFNQPYEICRAGLVSY
ncbi:hypothetical protein [Alicyclobacillus fodiniaquatilis]|uniref:Uncharacterized protein n=1 Tax=Alicyclobacillus fodiniaquatilis TaxID=1661150 RepID=A0ABW4JHC4_9BACL